MRQSSRSGSGSRTRSEWIGGRFPGPFVVGTEARSRPDLLLWLELPSGLVLAHDVVPAGERPAALAEAFERALRAPLAGPPRRPGRVRVESEALASSLRSRLGEGVELVVAPTPELSEIKRMMAEHPSFGGDGPEPSYLEEGSISETAMADLFEAAAALHACVPWKKANTLPPIRVDVAELEVSGACAIAIGSAGESTAILLLPSLEAYDAFSRAAEQSLAKGRVDHLGSDVLALDFERAPEVPVRMRDEVSRHGWRLPRPDTYPLLGRRSHEGIPLPVTPHDVEVMTACAFALSAFLLRRGPELTRWRFEPVSESVDTSSGRRVRLTAPYDAFDLFEPELDDASGTDGELFDEGPATPFVRSPKVGRNDPCPCGSGKKYKKCHLALESAEPQALARPFDPEARDDALVGDLVRLGQRRFPAGWKELRSAFLAVPEVDQLRVPFLSYVARFEGRSLVEWYVEERGERLLQQDSDILRAQREAWIGIWEVRDVEPGLGMTICDLLTQEVRRVRERKASTLLVARDTLLGRVVELGGVHVIRGMYPRPLGPEDAAEVVARARTRLRGKSGGELLTALRDPNVSFEIVTLWERAVEARDRLAAVPPVLHNTDGDPLLLTVDHFRFEPSARAEIEAALAKIEGVTAPELGDEDPSYVFLRSGNALHAHWDNTVVGRAFFVRDELRLESNSTKRADALRARVEQAAGKLLRHRAREHSDPMSERARGQRSQPSPAPPSPEMLAAVREEKERVYEAWLDQPIPALGGKTPRRAARSKRGRDEVDLLLKTIENREAHLPAAECFDVGKLRVALGLPP